ncbi:MAG: 2-C-methyl-D-erythritol 4-phosphate cytidylyltransferase [Cyclobacteriaceae bacterium]|nr:2-C-methyl-D-erythritol 4-phosphate cytidylyltransferase [Cytophagales bacterium]HNP76169.1 2-C-methyl-D-erythritol 4-phosphate cytidylyltransferase [Cyclobacteriaceae bacterium]HQQ82560.1 2-C-methyl-D-erythritol 4-phosphate cytidylyltransferase [Cyclobacteriaceae bacterium]
MAVREYALVVAGGKGTRIPGTLPKQFLPLNGRPILLHTLDAFHRYNTQLPVVLVLPADDRDTWVRITQEHQVHNSITLVDGGETRFQSVRNGLAVLSGDGLVAIHDGVRPLISEDIIGASFRLAAAHKTAIAAVRLKESIRMTDQDTTRAVDRSRFRLIQTPQTFDLSLIRKAYQQKEDATMTDDASVAERAGFSISLFEGSYENIKITTPEDLVVAEALLKQKS